MLCVQVKWLHSSPYDPVELYYEMDRNGQTHRGIEVFADGSVGKDGIYAPIPTLDEINAIPEFEVAWSKLSRSGKVPFENSSLLL